MTNKTDNSTVAHLALASYGQELAVSQMYMRGRHFLWAALTLQNNKGDGYVVLHLFCQAIELILKSLLLKSDFNKYNRRLGGKARAKGEATFGHDLEMLAKELCNIYGVTLKKPVSAELKTLNQFFKNHVFRYGKLVDLFHPSDDIPYSCSLRRIRHIIRLNDNDEAKRYGSRA